MRIVAIARTSSTDPSGFECRASLVTSPVLKSDYNHVCIQVERDVPRKDQVTRIVAERTGRQAWLPQVDACGYIHYELYEEIHERLVTEEVLRIHHEIWSIELLKANANPPGGIRTGWGKTGTIGNILEKIPFVGMQLTEKTGWGIWLVPHECSAITEHVNNTVITPITPANPTGSVCDLVQRIINAAISVGQLAQTRNAEYFLRNSQGKWLGDAANTCNSAASEILATAGGVNVVLPDQAKWFPGWNHAFSSPGGPHMVPDVPQRPAATYPGR